MKTKTGKNWYKADLSNYTNEFLQEIILDLIEPTESKEPYCDMEETRE